MSVLREFEHLALSQMNASWNLCRDSRELIYPCERTIATISPPEPAVGEAGDGRTPGQETVQASESRRVTRSQQGPTHRARGRSEKNGAAFTHLSRVARIRGLGHDNDRCYQPRSVISRIRHVSHEGQETRFMVLILLSWPDPSSQGLRTLYNGILLSSRPSLPTILVNGVASHNTRVSCPRMFAFSSSLW